MTITRELFSRIISSIKAQSEKEDRISTSLEEMFDGYLIPTISEGLTNLLIDILKLEFDDDNDWIGWWIYEKEYGTLERLKAYNADGSEIVLNTIDKLYDFLILNKKEKGEK